MKTLIENAKYLHIVFNWKVKDSTHLVTNKSWKVYKVNVMGYWQGIIDMEDFRLYDIKVIENPQALRNKVFKSDLYAVPELTPNTGCEFEEAHESSHSKHAETPILNIALGKDGVISNPILPDDELIRIYESTRTIKEVGKVLEDANLIGKAAQIVLDYWMDERNQNGELRCLQVFKEALKFKSPKQIQTSLLHDPLEDYDVTLDELIKQGFSDEVIESLSKCLI